MSEHMSDATFGKVFAGTLAGMVALTIFLIALAHAVGGDAGSKASDVAINANNAETLARTLPVGSVAVGEMPQQVASAAPAESMSGEQVYQTACVVCHGAGIAGAPKFGDAAAWEPRIAQGVEILYEHALNGFNAMPAKGGNAGLSDDAVKSAVDYMTSGDGGGQGAATTTAEGTDASTNESQGEENNTEMAAAAADHSAGEAVYNASCSVCHTAGVAGAPKPGDAAAWEPRIAQGTEVLYTHALNGFNAMPPKGGNLSLSDDEVKGVVNFMLSTVQ